MGKSAAGKTFREREWGRERCGNEPPKEKHPPPKFLRKPFAHTQLRKKKNRLKKVMRQSRKHARQDDLLKARAEYSKVSRKLSLLNKLSRLHVEKKAAIKAQLNFNKDHWKFAKEMFDPPTAPYSIDKDATERHFKETYADNTRDFTFSRPPGLPRPALPVPFKSDFPGFQRFMFLLMKKSNGSAAGPYGNQYKVFKLFPIAATKLYNLCKRCKTEGRLPAFFGHAYMVLLSKPGKPTDHARHLRNIACASTGGKMFWTCMLDPLTSFLVDNKFIDTEIQKAVPGIPGCLEHSWSAFEALKDAKLNKRKICVALTDLKDAYGSIKHNLIQFALAWYGIPFEFATLVFRYYESLIAFVITPDWRTNPFKYGIGVFQGCVLSMLLFILVYQIIIDFLGAHGVLPYTFKRLNVTVLQKAFVDDHKLFNCSEGGAQYNLNKLQIIFEWSRCLCFNLKKCVAFALGDLRSQGGNSYGPFDPKLTFQGKPFKYLADDLHKFLGRLIAVTVSNLGAYDQTLKEFLTALEKIDTAPLNGSSKAWIYEFYVNAKILSWPFLIYPFAVSSIQKDFEAPATKFLKKWLKLAKPANPAILFLPKSQNGLGITAPVDKFKSLQVSAAHQLRSSVDPSISALVSSASARAATSHRWSPFVELEQAQNEVNFNHMFQGNQGTSGLGSGNFSRTSANVPLSRKEQRSAVVNSVKAGIAKSRSDSLRCLPMAGSFCRWENLIPSTINWNYRILNMSEAELSFVLNAQTQTLPDPSNLRRWSCNVHARCLVCGKPNSTAGHVTNCCPTALKQGRYSWRHDNLLCTLVPILKGLVATKNHKKSLSRSEHIRFVPVGTPQRRKSCAAPLSLLDSANDWQFQVDLKANPLIFPPATGVTTGLRPDIVIWSVSTKTVIWGELTCPLEELILDAHVRKKQKYLNLEIACHCKRWKVHAFPFEVGSIGFVGHSCRKFLSAIGLRGSRQKAIILELSSVARRSSFHLWQCRRSRSWVSPPLYPVKTSPTFDSVPKPVFAQPARVSLDISPLDRALKAHNKAKNHASLLRQKIRRLKAQSEEPKTTAVIRSKLRNPTLTALIVKNKKLARVRLNQSQALHARMKALFDDVVRPTQIDTPCLCDSGFPCKNSSELSAFGIQLDEYGLPLLNAIVNVSSRRPNMSSLPVGEPCISTVSLRGKSLDEINRLWLTDINAKRNSTEQLELSALMRL